MLSETLVGLHMKYSMSLLFLPDHGGFSRRKHESVWTSRYSYSAEGSAKMDTSICKEYECP
jgi:hypothetical protein